MLKRHNGAKPCGKTFSFLILEYLDLLGLPVHLATFLILFLKTSSLPWGWDGPLFYSAPFCMPEHEWSRINVFFCFINHRSKYGSHHFQVRKENSQVRPLGKEHQEQFFFFVIL